MSCYPTRPFKEVCSLQKGKKPALQAERQSGSQPYLTARYMRGTEAPQWVPEVDKNAVKVQSHELIIICDGSNSGETFNGVEGILSSTMAKVTHGIDIDTTFLRYFLISKLEKYAETKTGAAIPHLDLKGLREEKIPVPPFSEQQRIVGILDKTFEDIAKAKANTERNLANASELLDVHLDSFLQKCSSMGGVKPLLDLCDRKRGITYGVIKLGDHIDDGIHCLRTSNVRKLRIELDGIKRISPSISEDYSRTVLDGGEVLINVRGTLGGVAVVPDYAKGWNVSREVAVVPIDRQEVDPIYVSYIVAAPQSQRWLAEKTKGAAYVGINLEDLRLLPVPLPDRQSQAQLVDDLRGLLDETERLQRCYVRKMKAIERLKSSLLHQAFSGKL